MKKIKTYPNHLEIITSVFIPYKDFDLEDFLDVPTVTIQDIMNAWAPVCIEGRFTIYLYEDAAFSNQKQVYHIYFQLQNCGRRENN